MVAFIFVFLFVVGQTNSATATKTFQAASLLSGDLLQEKEAKSIARIEQRLTHKLLVGSLPSLDSLQAVLVSPNETCRSINDRKTCEENKGCSWQPSTKENRCRSTRAVMKDNIHEELKDEIRREVREDMKKDMREDIKRDATKDVQREIRSEKETDQMTKEVSDVVAEEVEAEETSEEKITPFAKKAMDVHGKTIAFFGGLLLILLLITAYNMCKRSEDGDDEEDFEDPATPGLLRVVRTNEGGSERYLGAPVNVLFLLVPLGVYAWHQSWNWWWVFWINWIAMIPSLSLISQASDALSFFFAGQMRIWISCACSDFPVLVWVILILTKEIDVLDSQFSWLVARGLLMGSALGRQLLVSGAVFAVAKGTELDESPRRRGNLSFFRQSAKFDATSVSMQAHVLMTCSFGVALPSVFAQVQDVTPTHLSRLSLAMAVFILANGVVFLAWQGISQKEGLLDRVKECTTQTTGIHVAVLLIGCALLTLSTWCMLATFMTFALVTGISPGCIGFMIAILGCLAHAHVVNWSRTGEVDTAINATFTSTIHIFLLYLPVVIIVGSFLNLHRVNFSVSGALAAAFMGSSFITLVTAIAGRANWMRGVMFVAVFVTVFLSLLLQPDSYDRIQ